MDDGEDAVESVVGRDAVVELETESIPKPILLGFGELSHADEIVGPANGGADDDQDDVHEVVDAFELDAWVTEFGEVVRQRSRGGHDNAPGGWSGTLSDPTRECARVVRPKMWERRTVVRPGHKRMDSRKSLANSCNCPAPASRCSPASAG